MGDPIYSNSIKKEQDWNRFDDDSGREQDFSVWCLVRMKVTKPVREWPANASKPVQLYQAGNSR
jgi:hypothetical protein